MVGALGKIRIARISNRDDDAVARLYFLDVVQHFFISLMRLRRIRIVCREEYDGQVFIDQRIRSVLHFTCGITFRVNIRKLLQLQRSLKRDWEMNTASKKQKIMLAEQTLRYIFNVLRIVQN